MSHIAIPIFIPSIECTGLVSTRNIQIGEIIARYNGREITISEANKLSKDHHYLMTATYTKDRRKKLVIDGNPEIYDNLAGYANYVCDKYANAEFVDAACDSQSDMNTNIILRARTIINSGCEIRVDYDRGTRRNPFRDQMIRNGVPRKNLNSSDYLNNIYEV